ncbi:MAG: hypothetical protein JWR85_3669, partial [Marmoricola sp.]|nr:hypothetical protein [Marmoricola sp.]
SDIYPEPGGPSLDPRHERINLLDDIQERYKLVTELGAIGIGDNLHSVTVLNGMVEPLHEDHKTAYSNLALSVVYFNQAQASLISSTLEGGNAFSRNNFNLRPSEVELASLGQRSAQRDATLRHILGRTVFTRTGSESALRRFSSPRVSITKDIAAILAEHGDESFYSR